MAGMLKNKFNSKQSQHLLEYALLIAIVTAAAMGMYTYVDRASRASIKALEDQVSEEAVFSDESFPYSGGVVIGGGSYPGCEAAGGTSYDIGGGAFICRFNRAYDCNGESPLRCAAPVANCCHSNKNCCPTGWIRYANWNTTVAVECYATTGTCAHCTTRSHSNFSDVAPSTESCRYYMGYPGCPGSMLGYPVVSSVGCTK